MHLANGLPAFNLVGLPDVVVRGPGSGTLRSDRRVQFPMRKLTVNLARNFPRNRAGLPIAVGILRCRWPAPRRTLERAQVCQSELGLNSRFCASYVGRWRWRWLQPRRPPLVLPTASAARRRGRTTQRCWPEHLARVAAFVAGRHTLDSPQESEQTGVTLSRSARRQGRRRLAGTGPRQRAGALC